MKMSIDKVVALKVTVPLNQKLKSLFGGTSGQPQTLQKVVDKDSGFPYISITPNKGETRCQ
jgi:hypothetical protein